MEFIKKHYSNILFGLLVVLLIYPPTRVQFLRLLSFSPSVESVENQVQLEHYNWSLKGINTADYDFNKAKNKIVIVNFWATWCMPCVAEMPSLEALYKDYGDKVDFILVTTDEVTKITPFMKEKGFTLPIYQQLTKAPSEFETTTIPRTFLIDKQGRIIIDTGRANWNSSSIRRLLDSLIEN
jgi:thiol-disulfide isomerase/thioredoxin